MIVSSKKKKHKLLNFKVEDMDNEDNTTIESKTNDDIKLKSGNNYISLMFDKSSSASEVDDDETDLTWTSFSEKLPGTCQTPTITNKYYKTFFKSGEGGNYEELKDAILTFCENLSNKIKTHLEIGGEHLLVLCTSSKIVKESDSKDEEIIEEEDKEESVLDKLSSSFSYLKINNIDSIVFNEIIKENNNKLDTFIESTSNKIMSLQNNWEYSIIPNEIKLPHDTQQTTRRPTKARFSDEEEEDDDSYYDDELPVGASMEEIQDVVESIPKLSNLSQNNDYYHPILLSSSSSSTLERLNRRIAAPPLGSSYQELNAININIKICNEILESNPKLEDMGDILQIEQREHHLSYEFLSEIYREAFMRNTFFDDKRRV